jgi:hypothetical protein
MSSKATAEVMDETSGYSRQQDPVRAGEMSCSARMYYVSNGEYIFDSAIQDEQLDLLLYSDKNSDVEQYLFPLAMRQCQDSVKAGSYPFSTEISALLVEYVASLGIVFRSAAANIIKDIHVIIHSTNESFSITLKHRVGAFSPSEIVVSI